MNLQAMLEKQAHLNYYVTETAGKDTAFHILYWGGLLAHLDQPIHKHSHIEVCFILNGEGIYEEEGLVFEVRADTLLLSRPGLWRKLSSSRGIDLIWVGFELTEDRTSQNLMQKLAESNQIRIPDARESSTMLFWHSLLAQVEPGKSYLTELLPNLAHVLIISFFQEFIETKEAAPDESEQPFREAIKTQLFYLIVRYIRDNLSRPLYLRDLSSYFKVSQRHLIRLFHQETGLNFSEYVQKERLRRAMSYMQTTLLPLKEIAAISGFSSIHHFTRVFKKETGQTPARFRKNIGISLS